MPGKKDKKLLYKFISMTCSGENNPHSEDGLQLGDVLAGGGCFLVGGLLSLFPEDLFPGWYIDTSLVTHETNGMYTMSMEMVEASSVSGYEKLVSDGTSLDILSIRININAKL